VEEEAVGAAAGQVAKLRVDCDVPSLTKVG
jgi:hypothetical protein